jgi:7,8-dihydroneopterin aldolase/epimerase/oxygenase
VDKIFIDNLVIPCRVGITEKERSRRQALLVDLYVFRDLKDAGISDDPEKTSSYSEISENVFSFVSKGEFKLLESIAEGISSLLLKNPLVVKVKVRVRKKKYSSIPSIGIEITRTRHG